MAVPIKQLLKKIAQDPRVRKAAIFLALAIAAALKGGSEDD